MNVTDAFFARARAAPDAPALDTAQGGLNYAELARAVIAAQHGFAREGLKPGDLAGVAVPRQVQQLVAMLALARLGAGQIPLGDSDPPLLRAELARRLKLAAVVAGEAGAVAGVPRIEPPSDRVDELRRAPQAQASASTDGALPFLVRRSSGTTAGVPKLGLLTQAQALRWLDDFAETVPRGPAVRYLPILDIGLVGAVHGVLRCLGAGGCLVLAGEPVGGEQAALEFVLRHGVNYIYGTAVHAGVLLKLARGPLLLPQLDAFAIGSTLIPDALRADIRARLTPNLFVFYGINEVGMMTIAPPELVARVPGTVGFPVPGLEIRIVDDAERPLPPGERGLLRARGPAMMNGYLDDPEETARAFRDGWFHSSDIVELTAEGALIHHGRADDVMIFDGINIVPSEIESALLRHPAVAEAAAFPVRSDARGDLPMAAVVVRSATTEEELLKFCRGRLGVRSPKRVLIVKELPRNASGKVLKRELAALVRP
ncbi:MAG TPA: fatty acid--CoA ligase family protein [Burkholderiales bacterium]|nr:fatty acid--CoA ligase family protein [Burkholderiales bacterium]